MIRPSVSLLISIAILSVISRGSLTGSGCVSCQQPPLGMTLYPGNSGVGNSLSSSGSMGIGNSLSSAGSFDIASTLSSVGLGAATNMGNTLSSGGYGNGNSLSSGYGNSLSSGYGNSLSSGYGPSLSAGYNSMSSGYGNSMSSGYGLDINSVIGGINSINYNANNMGGLTTNLGSLGIGSGVGLNTTGLNLGNLNPIGGDASFILNTPSLTGTTFTNQFLNNVDSNPGTITAVTTIPGTGSSTATLPPIPPVVVNPTQTVSQPVVTAMKVKD